MKPRKQFFIAVDVEMPINFLFLHVNSCNGALLNVESKTKIRKRYNQVPHLTRDTVTPKQNIQESQEVSRLAAGDHKAARNRQDSITKINMKPEYRKGSTKEALPWNCQQKITGGLKHVKRPYF